MTEQRHDQPRIGGPGGPVPRVRFLHASFTMVLKGFGSGERFPSSKDPTPGPGAYDPKADLGGKVDPRSGFLTGDRFQDSQDGQSAGRVPTEEHLQHQWRGKRVQRP